MCFILRLGLFALASMFLVRNTLETYPKWHTPVRLHILFSYMGCECTLPKLHTFERQAPLTTGVWGGEREKWSSVDHELFCIHRPYSDAVCACNDLIFFKPRMRKIEPRVSTCLGTFTRTLHFCCFVFQGWGRLKTRCQESSHGQRPNNVKCDMSWFQILNVPIRNDLMSRRETKLFVPVLYNESISLFRCGSRCRTRFGVATETPSAGKLFNCIRWVLSINRILSDHRISPDAFSVPIYRGDHNLGLCTTSHLTKAMSLGTMYIWHFLAEITVFCPNCQTVYSGIVFAKVRVSVSLFINSTQPQRCELMSWLIH